MKKMMLMAAYVLLMAGGAAADNTLTVEDYAALNGTNYGMMVSLDGTTNTVYVQDDTPDNEEVYRAVFWFDPNSVTMAQGASRMVIFFTRDLDPAGGRGGFPGRGSVPLHGAAGALQPGPGRTAPG